MTRRSGSRVGFVVLVFVLGAATFVAGCSLSTFRVTLPAPSQTSRIPVTRAPARGDVISVVRPKGQGENVEIGDVVSDKGRSVRTVVASLNDPGLWVANTLIAGLQRAGYQVEFVENVQSATTERVIAVDVIDVSARMQAGFIDFTEMSQVIARVRVYNRSEQILDRKYSGTHRTRFGFLLTHYNEDEFERSLDLAMTDFLDRALPDLTAFLAAHQ
jgi:hypothetical protein